MSVRLGVTAALAAAFIATAAAQPGQAPASEGRDEVPASDEAMKKIYVDISGEEMLALVRSQGWNAEMSPDSETPFITGDYVAEDGRTLSFTLGLYNCLETRRCREYSFAAGIDSPSPVTPRMASKYNELAIIGTAYILNDGRPAVAFGGTLRGGVSEAHLLAVMDWWKNLQTNFVGTMAERNKPPEPAPQ